MIRNPSKYLPNSSRLIDLEDLISTNPVDGEFRFDLLIRAEGQNTITIFVDTKNYSSASNIFTDMSQVKAYFKRIGSFDEFRIVQQSRPGITLNNVQKAFQNALKNNDYEIFEVIWSNTNLRNRLWDSRVFNKSLAKTQFTEWVNDNNIDLFNILKITN